MKCTTIIDKTREEEVIIYAKEQTEFVEKIEAFVKSNSLDLTGYLNDSIIKLNITEIYCFAIEGGKIFAYTSDKRFLIKRRLYEIENMLDKSFVKINQSCIVSVSKIERFSASIAGSLLVVLKNGYKDYVSRRQLKFVKERLGI